MEADFSGYATKAGLTCSDGRTIMPDAFRHQHSARVPLVWQHGHGDVENVLGHAILENRDDGVYAYCFFNDSDRAKHAKELVKHGDINQLSIWANELVQRSKRVLHGAIREVSLVLSGANPGALIDNVSIRHSDGSIGDELEDEAVIFTGLHLAHGNGHEDEDPNGGSDDDDDDDDDDDEVVEHAAGDKTVQDVVDSMTDEQKQVLYFMVGSAEEAGRDAAKEENNSAKHGNTTQEGTDEMGNVFEGQDTKTPALSHDAMKGIIADATKNGSLREAVEGYALQHGITDIETLFPDAKALAATPELFGRRTEWVAELINGCRKSPFSRIKTVSADITHEEARAKGYIKGSLKKEEFFGVAKRETTPTTIYKKQKLDRDDVIDITDFDVVAWMKAEMRLMLDEEIARAILVGDGRDPAHDDKISETNIRPVAKDHELYVTTINVNLDDSNSSVSEAIDAIVLNRRHFRGTGTPTLFTSELYIARLMLLRDNMGRRLYRSLDEVAAELRVAKIVPVEVLEEYPEIVGVMFNPIDYNIGADRGGAVTMFDDFDIDYNQHKYLIETRISGALIKLKSAILIKKTAASATLVVPTEPTFEDNTVTVPTITGVTYKNALTNATLTTASPVELDPGETLQVMAVPSSASYYFATSEDDQWQYTHQA
jgi:HK97 family phage prohead protease